MSQIAPVACGFFKCNILDRIYPLPDGLNLTPVMSTRAIHEGIRMFEVPIPYSERLGRSKLSIFRDGSIFLQSIVWTVMTYNPVRVLGLIGLLGVITAGLVIMGSGHCQVKRGNHNWTMGCCRALCCNGISRSWNSASFLWVPLLIILVSLFYKTPIRQGLFGKTSISIHL